jgi:polyhydroxyalkanoate synthesis regulator phasin
MFRAFLFFLLSETNFLPIAIGISTFNFQLNKMKELIEKLKSEAGLTEEQAKKAVDTIKQYVVEKFPMLEGAVNNVFGGDN